MVRFIAPYVLRMEPIYKIVLNDFSHAGDIFMMSLYSEKDLNERYPNT